LVTTISQKYIDRAVIGLSQGSNLRNIFGLFFNLSHIQLSASDLVFMESDEICGSLEEKGELFAKYRLSDLLVVMTVRMTFRRSCGSS
jgi:6-phosphogluconolactonase/glucosamine-6-phosphate isomerase/deaminase